MQGLSRGLRNRNPGNIRLSDDKWQGLADEQPDDEFFTFQSPAWGIRALAVLLINYQDRYGRNTITKIINRWAPPSENDTGAYVRSVAASTGFRADQVLDMHSYDHLAPMVRAIILHENGQQPYSDDQINRGLVMAGVRPESRADPALRAAGVGSTGLGASAGLEGVQQLLDTTQGQMVGLASYLDVAKYVLIALSLASLGFMVWRLLKERKQGLR